MAEEWRAARDRQVAADEAASRSAELDALASAVVAEIRKAPVERLSASGVTVMRPNHNVYMTMGGWSRCNSSDSLRNELNTRLTGVQASRVTVRPRRGLLHRVCQCGCAPSHLSFGDDECPLECCCCILWSAACACLPLAYWIPRMCGDRDDLIAEWEIRVHVQEAPFGGGPKRWS